MITQDKEKNTAHREESSPQDEHEAPDPIESLKTELAALNDQMLRRAAEFENYKRRVDRERADWLSFANERVFLAMLPIVDDLERSLNAAKSAAAEDPMFAGIELIRQKFVKTLEGFGVKSFDSVGQPFTVDFHEALMQVDRPDVAPHTVVEEIERGYYLNDKVLRHAKVLVAAEPS